MPPRLRDLIRPSRSRTGTVRGDVNAVGAMGPRRWILCACDPACAEGSEPEARSDAPQYKNPPELTFERAQTPPFLALLGLFLDPRSRSNCVSIRLPTSIDDKISSTTGPRGSARRLAPVEYAPETRFRDYPGAIRPLWKTWESRPPVALLVRSGTTNLQAKCRNETSAKVALELGRVRGPF
jgi:hypothetical protein